MDNIPKDLKQLKTLVAGRIAYSWHNIAIQLGFTTDELDKITENYRQLPVDDCCKHMLEKWKKKNVNVTEEKLIDAIRSVNNERYAEDLHKG